MDKRFWIIIGIITVALVGFLFWQSNKAEAPSGNSSGASSNITGNAEAEVVLVEYADYQCPYCALYHGVVEQVKEKYGDQISIQFYHLPLPQIHQNAFAAARAAEAAAQQDKFWEMSTLLFQNQAAWSDSNNAKTLFDQYAAQLDLDMDKFNQDFSSSATNDRINADIALFRETGEKTSTPTFFLNGKKVQPQASLEDFSKYIDEAIAEKVKNE